MPGLKNFFNFVSLIEFIEEKKGLKTNKKKIINDPVFGFITIQSDLIFDLVEHPYFQRLRRIKQLGLSCIVFPGANHTRFEHAIGTVFLMHTVISGLKLKGVAITGEEAEAVTVAILLHDIGHGPFSHTLEHSIVEGVPHEHISALLMEDLNRQFDGRLTLAIRIFKNQYPKRFLHQLVASQLDMDRLDYLRRDSFYTGVTEGMIGSDRIIKMLNVCNDELVIEAKGIYSIEKFLIARRLMYWQVYLHKTVLSADHLLMNILKRAKELVMDGVPVFATPSLFVFLARNVTCEHFLAGEKIYGRSLLSVFAELDDNDIMASVKQWQYHDDRILSFLSRCLIQRRLYKIKIENYPLDPQFIDNLKDRIVQQLKTDQKYMDYFLVQDSITNSAYAANDDKINILLKTGKVCEISEASDINLSSLSQTVRKYFVCYPKELVIN